MSDNILDVRRAGLAESLLVTPAVLNAYFEERAQILTPREREVVELYYGIVTAEVLTQREIAAKLSVSSSRAAQLLTRALRKLVDEAREELPDDLRTCTVDQFFSPRRAAEANVPDGILTRTLNALRIADVLSIENLLSLTHAELGRCPNLGVHGLDALEAMLNTAGFTLESGEDDYASLAHLSPPQWFVSDGWLPEGDVPAYARYFTAEDAHGVAALCPAIFPRGSRSDGTMYLALSRVVSSSRMAVIRARGGDGDGQILAVAMAVTRDHLVHGRCFHLDTVISQTVGDDARLMRQQLTKFLRGIALQETFPLATRFL